MSGLWIAQRRYSSRYDGQKLGPWAEGDQIEVSDDVAAWVNRDSPGTLDPAPVPAPVDESTPDEPTVPAEREKRPAADRMRRGGRSRAL